jgi:hypothetical protein
MRPRIKPSAVLVAKSTDSTEQLRRNEAIIRKAAKLDDKDNGYYAIVFGEKYKINRSDVYFYIENGFTVITPQDHD